MKSISYKVKCGVILALALASALMFALMPLITIRPADFGIEEAKGVRISRTVWDIREDFSSLESKITDKMSIEEIKNLEEQYGALADLIPGYSKEELHEAVKILTWWMKFPVFLTIAVAVAFAGFLIAGGFAVAGLAGIRNKWVHTGWSAIGSVMYILVGIVLCYWGIKALHDLTVILDNEAVRKLFDIQSLLGDNINPVQTSLALLVRCTGAGLAAPWFASVVMFVLGLISMRERVPETMIPERKETIEEHEDLFPPTGENTGMEIRVMENTGKGRINVIAGEYAGYELMLEEGESLCIGSDPGFSQLVLSDRKIAPCHCRITYYTNDTKKASAAYSGGGRYFTVTNLSPNGTVRIYNRRGHSATERTLPYRKTCEVRIGTEVYLENGENKFLLV